MRDVFDEKYVGKQEKKCTLEVLTVEPDLAEEFLFGATDAGWDSFPSEDGIREVPGGASSLFPEKLKA